MVSLAGATRAIGIHKSSSPLEDLIKNQLIEYTQKASGRYDIPQHEVNRLAAIAANKTYTSGVTQVNFNLPYAFAAPTNDCNLGAELSLSAHNGLTDAKKGFQNKFGITLQPGQSVTGWWAVDDSIAKDLAQNKRLILGIVGGLVIEVGRISCTEFYARPEDNRKAFIIEKLDTIQSQKFIGYVPRMNNTGTYVQL
ncbi:hypothetical protein [Rothia nasimurium]|uniref:hypothetical protein n=1 Tax=Rothia nasimurium TaxID=85336 RepID=UPI001F292CBB|nr:hypothetical protein [Rothia nasimurium]